MKKNYLVIFVLACLAILAISGCGPATGDVNQFIAADDEAATEVTAMDAATTANLQGGASGDALVLSAITGETASTPVNAAGQVITMDFNYVVDSATVESSINFYPLTSANLDNETVCTRGNALPRTFLIVPDAAVPEGCKVVFTVDFTQATAVVEIYINAATLTSKGGTQKLDRNGNTIQGEANDDFVGQVAVKQAVGASAPAAVANVVLGEPTQTAGFGLFGSSESDIGAYVANMFNFSSVDTSDGTAAENRISVPDAAVSVFKNVDGVWTAVTGRTVTNVPTPTGTTGNITLTTAPVAGETYKFVVDLYQIVETTAIKGYTHRVTYDVKNISGSRYATRYVNFHRTNVNAYNGQTFTITPGGEENAWYFDVVAADADGLAPTDVTPVNLSTVTANGFKVRLNTGAVMGSGTTGTYTTTSPVFVPVTFQIMETGVWDQNNAAVTKFRVYLPKTVKTLADGNSVIVAPTVLSLDDNAHTGFGLRYFGDVLTGTDGSRVIAFDAP